MERKSKIRQAIQLKSNTFAQRLIMESVGVNMKDNLLPFDIFCVETNFTTWESSKLFALSLVKHGRSISDKIRLVFFINNAQSGMEVRYFSFLQEMKHILNGFNVEFVRIGLDKFNEYNVCWGRTNNVGGLYQSISHGLVIYEYLKYHSDSSLFTLLCHSDTEFTEDLSGVMAEWQEKLKSERKAGVCFQKLHDNGIMYMNSWYSLWKTPILYEYAVRQNVPISAVDERRIGGRFYDTGAYLNCVIESEYDIEYISDPAPARHWGSMTSEIVFQNETSAAYKIKNEDINKRSKELMKELQELGAINFSRENE